MMARAENAIKKATVKFNDNLTSRVHELEQAL